MGQKWDYWFFKEKRWKHAENNSIKPNMHQLMGISFIDEVQISVFSQKMMGDAFAVIPTDGKINFTSKSEKY